MLRIVCAWCGREMGFKEGTPLDGYDATSTICPECEDRVRERYLGSEGLAERKRCTRTALRQESEPDGSRKTSPVIPPLPCGVCG